MLRISPLIGFGSGGGAVVGPPGGGGPAAPGIRSHATAVNTSGMTITVDKPTGTIDGDIMIAQIIGTSFFPEVLAGWTQRALISDSALKCGIYTKEASSEPANYLWTFPDGTGHHAAGIITLIDAILPPDVIATDVGTGTTSNVICPGVTTTVDNCRLFTFPMLEEDGSVAPPGGTTELYDVTPGSGFLVLGCGHEIISGAGPTGTRTWTNSPAILDDCAVTLAIAPAP
jgi:hypothetical protein